MSTLAERIHRACPCVGDADRDSGHEHGRCFGACRCSWLPDSPSIADAQPACLWEGHAIAGEVKAIEAALEKAKDWGLKANLQAGALTAKVEEGHAQGCRCGQHEELCYHQKDGDGCPMVDPRCVEWRRK